MLVSDRHRRRVRHARRAARRGAVQEEDASAARHGRSPAAGVAASGAGRPDGRPAHIRPVQARADTHVRDRRAPPGRSPLPSVSRLPARRRRRRSRRLRARRRGSRSLLGRLRRASSSGSTPWTRGARLEAAARRSGSSAASSTPASTASTATCARARRNKAALIWEGEPGDRRTLTYCDLHREVSTLRQRPEVARREARAIASRSTCR